MGIGKALLKAGKSVVKLTPIGKRIEAGVCDARVAVNRNCIQLVGNNNDILNTIKSNISSGGINQAIDFANRNNTFQELLFQYVSKTLPKFKNVKAKTDAKAYQEIIEKAGITPTKIAQMLSDDPEFLSKIEDKALIVALKNTKSKCSFNQTVQEAQMRIDTGFEHVGGGGYHIIEPRSAASVGAVYDVTRPGMENGVAKMIKKGVNDTQLSIEEGLMKQIINEYGGTEQQKKEAVKMLENFCNGIKEEFNLFKEFENNKLLAQGAKRYRVAKITDISKDGKIIIMDKAEGIQMNKLLDMLKDYKANPEIFQTKYAKQIAENPWLKNPDKVINELQRTILRAFDEQFLFLKKGGFSVMHGDPHTGNFFISADKKGNLIPEFIDTGNCIKRTSKEIVNDLKFFSNFFVGNSKGVAEYFVEQCGCNGPDKAKLIDKVARDIQKNIFGKNQNTTDYSTVLKNINVILEKHGLKINIENATAMKAQMQFLSVAKETAILSGQKLDFITILKDVPKASFQLLKNGENPMKVLKDAGIFAFYNQQQASKTMTQYFYNQGEKILAELPPAQVPVLA